MVVICVVLRMIFRVVVSSIGTIRVMRSLRISIISRGVPPLFGLSSKVGWASICHHGGHPLVLIEEESHVTGFYMQRVGVILSSG